MVRLFYLFGAVRFDAPSEEDSDLVCQPGAKWMDINETLKEKGIPLFFPVNFLTLICLFYHNLTAARLKIDPAPGATIGGMLSTGCSGSELKRLSLTGLINEKFQPTQFDTEQQRQNGF